MKNQKTKTFKAGELIFKQGQYATEAFLISDGEVMIYGKNKNAEVTLATAGPNEIIGEMSFFNQHTRTANVLAIKDTKCHIISSDYILRKIEESDTFIKCALRTTTLRLHHLNQAFIGSEEENLNQNITKLVETNRLLGKELFTLRSQLESTNKEIKQFMNEKTLRIRAELLSKQLKGKINQLEIARKELSKKIDLNRNENTSSQFVALRKKIAKNFHPDTLSNPDETIKKSEVFKILWSSTE